jgi:hypothetical protein
MRARWRHGSIVGEINIRVWECLHGKTWSRLTMLRMVGLKGPFADPSSGSAISLGWSWLQQRTT